jgi:Mg2+ and Co2+ transporter CorA
VLLLLPAAVWLAQMMLADQDLTALADHAQRLMDLVVNTVAQTNSNANTSLTILSTIFLPLTFIAGKKGLGVQ